MKSIIFTIVLTMFAYTQAYAWTIKSDFEGGTVGQKADTDPSGAGYAFKQTIFSNENPHTGNKSAKATVSAGSGGWGDWGVFYTFPKAYEGDEIWFRAWLYFPANFQYNAEHGAKGMRIRSFHGDGGHGGYIDMYPAEKSIKMGNELDWGGITNNNPTLSFSPGIVGWEAFEMYVKFSFVRGQGIYRFYRNGELIFEDTQSRTMETPDSYAKSIIIFGLYSNNPSPVTQSSFIDDVIITNERPSNFDSNGNPYIGVGNVEIVAPPNPPSIR